MESDIRIEELLGRYYPMLPPWTRITRFSGRTMHVIHTVKGKYLLKQHDQLISVNRGSLQSVYRTCEKAGLTPEFIVSGSQEYIVQAFGNLYSVQKMLGEATSQRDMNETDPNLLGLNVAALHKALKKGIRTPILNHLDRAVGDMIGYAGHYGYQALLPAIQRQLDLKSLGEIQVIHGDLHPGNIIINDKICRFIDLDSATSSLPLSDVAFSAFRIYGGNMDKIKSYIAAYNDNSDTTAVTLEDLWTSLVYTVMQRILFIRIEQDKGNTKWVWDLVSQQTYLETLLSRKHLFVKP